MQFVVCGMAIVMARVPGDTPLAGISGCRLVEQLEGTRPCSGKCPHFNSMGCHVEPLGTACAEDRDLAIVCGSKLTGIHYHGWRRLARALPKHGASELIWWISWRKLALAVRP
eukprot:982594-Amphidinium_carterae.1